MTILFSDSWYVAVAKQPGLAVQSRRAEPTVVRLARELLGDPELHACHRIDQPVGGIVVLARGADAFTAFQKALQHGAVSRWYLAVVAGRPNAGTSDMIDRISTDSRRNISRIDASGREARSSYTVVGHTRHHTLLLVTLDTGRHHQIRLQLASRGMPVVGDTRYGARRPTRDGSIALHAAGLALPHPASPVIRLVAPPPDLPVWRGVRLAAQVAVAPHPVLVPLLGQGNDEFGEERDRSDEV